MKGEECYDNDDPDSGSPVTELVEGSCSSEDLFVLILGGPSRQRFNQFPRSQETIILAVGTFVLPSAAI